MKVIYIAGRYRDERGEYYVRCNIRDAERAALCVWKFGGVALCPHKNTAGFGGAWGMPDRIWLDGDLELIRRCDAVWMIPGWQSSSGARGEKEFAESLGIPVFTDQGDVLEYLTGDTK